MRALCVCNWLIRSWGVSGQAPFEDPNHHDPNPTPPPRSCIRGARAPLPIQGTSSLAGSSPTCRPWSRSQTLSRSLGPHNFLSWLRSESCAWMGRRPPQLACACCTSDVHVRRHTTRKRFLSPLACVVIKSAAPIACGCAHASARNVSALRVRRCWSANGNASTVFLDSSGIRACGAGTERKAALSRLWLRLRSSCGPWRVIAFRGMVSRRVSEDVLQCCRKWAPSDIGVRFTQRDRVMWPMTERCQHGSVSAPGHQRSSIAVCCEDDFRTAGKFDWCGASLCRLAILVRAFPSHRVWLVDSL